MVLTKFKYSKRTKVNNQNNGYKLKLVMLKIKQRTAPKDDSTVAETNQAFNKCNFGTCCNFMVITTVCNLM
jgi:hypothetical protein